MKSLIIYTIIILIFIVIGQFIASYNKKFIKHNLNTTNRMVNNYYGNLISTIGFFILCACIFGITNFMCFSIYSISIFIFYIIHVSQASGSSIDEILGEMIENKNEKKYMFRKQTYIIIISLLITGFISTSIVAPIIFKEEVIQKEIPEEIIPTMEKTDDKEKIEEQEYIKELN